jgi:hypothetical protein
METAGMRRFDMFATNAESSWVRGASFALKRGGMVVILALCGGCAVTPYPSDWPGIDRAKLIGDCPDISGKYRNQGASHPSDAKPLSLTQVLGVKDGDRVTIEQSKDAISVTASDAGEVVETIVFAKKRFAMWHTNPPRNFGCPSPHELYFSHMTQPPSGPGSFGAFMVSEVEGAYFAKTNDGSLLLTFEKGWGALFAIVPAGRLDRIWYRFAPIE